MMDLPAILERGVCYHIGSDRGGNIGRLLARMNGFIQWLCSG